MIRVISSFADGPVNFHSTGPVEDQIQKLISSTEENKTWMSTAEVFITFVKQSHNLELCSHMHMSRIPR